MVVLNLGQHTYHQFIPQDSADFPVRILRNELPESDFFPWNSACLYDDCKSCWRFNDPQITCWMRESRTSIWKAAECLTLVVMAARSITPSVRFKEFDPDSVSRMQTLEMFKVCEASMPRSCSLHSLYLTTFEAFDSNLNRNECRDGKGAAHLE